MALTAEQINAVKKVGLANYSKPFFIACNCRIFNYIHYYTNQFFNYLFIHFFVADAFDKLKSCQNGAACVPSGDGYTCACGVGFQGTNCEHGQ